MDFLITGKKPIQDENQRVMKLTEENLKLSRACDNLKKRNKILEKALKAFLVMEDR